MNCFVCNKVISDGTNRCKRCGFPIIRPINDDPSMEVRRKGDANSYRNKKLGGIAVGIVVYNWDVSDFELKKGEEEVMYFSKWSELHENQTDWLNERFQSAKGEKEIELELIIERKVCYVCIPVNWDQSDWKVGVKKEQSGNIRICVESENNYYQSDKINLFDYI